MAEKEKATVKAESQAAEAVYTAEELSAGADHVFSKKYTEDIVAAALRLAGVKSATVSEAEAVIKKFLA